MSKPTIVLVPSSFSARPIYTILLTHLRSAGYPSLEVQLPSTQKRMPLLPATMTDDANVIRRIAETLLSQGKQVVVVAQSYGGTPTSQALAGLAIKRIVYVSAVVPRVGQTQGLALGMEDGVLPMEAVDGYMHVDAVGMAGAVCNDLPWDLAYENALCFPHHSAPSFLEKATAIAYDNIPVSYLLCEDDVIISPEQQRKFISVIEEVSGKKVAVVSLKSGHCPNFSIPERLAEVLAQEAERE